MVPRVAITLASTTPPTRVTRRHSLNARFCLLERVRDRSPEGDGCIEGPIRDLRQVPHVEYPTLLDGALAAGFPGFLGVELQLNGGHVGDDDGRPHRRQLDREPARAGPDLEHPPAGLKEAAQETPVQLQGHQCPRRLHESLPFTLAEFVEVPPHAVHGIA